VGDLSSLWVGGERGGGGGGGEGEGKRDVDSEGEGELGDLMDFYECGYGYGYEDDR
jgi:hypothetical protein